MQNECNVKVCLYESFHSYVRNAAAKALWYVRVSGFQLGAQHGSVVV